MTVNNDRSLIIKVAHVDDDVFELERVQKALNTKVGEFQFLLESFETDDCFFKKVPKEFQPDVVILDVNLDTSSRNGDQLAGDVRKILPNALILMCSSQVEHKTISTCIKNGADDFISKTAAPQELTLRLANAYEKRFMSKGSNKLTEQTINKLNFTGKTLDDISKRIPKILSSAISSVHIFGETGTGKEAVVDLFDAHLNGKKLVRMNCGAITPSLLESELFGHVKGAFTGASVDKKGLIEEASGGWIFLDEVATLSKNAQIALLRVIENQEVTPVGSSKTKKIDVRFLSATNENLEEQSKSGSFRSDLWQRLCETKIVLAPLRDRPQEIGQLVEFFAKSMSGGPYQVSSSAMEVLCSAPWKEGNIRELRNCLRAMTESHVDSLLTPMAIPPRIWDHLDDSDLQKNQQTDLVAVASKDGTSITLPISKEQGVNYEYLNDLLFVEILKVIKSNDGKQSLRSIAKTMCISRSTLSSRVKSVVERNVLSVDEMAELTGK